MPWVIRFVAVCYMMHIASLMVPHKEKSKGAKLNALGEIETGPPRPIHLPAHCSSRSLIASQTHSQAANTWLHFTS
jgi:hypothetical protein